MKEGKKIAVAIFFGGISREREVSIQSANFIIEELKKNTKFKIFTFDFPKEIEKFWKQKNKIDLVFPVLHGNLGEDGHAAAICNIAKIPFISSEVRSAAMCMNKFTTKVLARKFKIPVVDDIFIKKLTNDTFRISENGKKFFEFTEKNFLINLKKKIKKINFPVIIKPAENGSSVGVEIIKNWKSLQNGLKKIWKIDSQILIEKFLTGQEITIGVLEKFGRLEILPSIEIKPNKSHFYDFSAKYSIGGSNHIIPANIPSKTEKKLKKISKEIFQILDCKNLARIDFFIVKDKIFLIEVNTLPGFTKISLFPEAAKSSGINFGELLEILIFSTLQN